MKFKKTFTSERNGISFNTDQMSEMERLIISINHEFRQSIVNLLHLKSLYYKSMNVTDIFIDLRVEQSVVSAHLRVLRMAKVVKTKRDGKKIIYSIDSEGHERLLAFCRSIAGEKICNPIQVSQEVFRALKNDLRIDILSFINQEGFPEVNEIYKSLGISQSICSQHLKILRDSRIVIAERNGKNVNYCVNYARLQDIQRQVENFNS